MHSHMIVKYAWDILHVTVGLVLRYSSPEVCMFLEVVSSKTPHEMLFGSSCLAPQFLVLLYVWADVCSCLE